MIFSVSVIPGHTNRPDALRALTLSRVLIYGHVFHALHFTQQQCMKAVCTNDSFELKNDRLMRCKYTKFLYRANGCEIFFFDLTISLLTYLLEITKIKQMLLSLNDRFKTSKPFLNQALQSSFRIIQIQIIFITISSSHYS